MNSQKHEMIKRKFLKDDGRLLIFYTFEYSDKGTLKNTEDCQESETRPKGKAQKASCSNESPSERKSDNV